MPSSNTQLIESVAYEGALDWSAAIWVFLAVASLNGWLAWRERKITGAATASLFFLLRLAAVSMVLWMLLGPTHLATTRTTIPQTLAIVVDSSQSMEVAEPMEKIERIRWQQAIDNESPAHAELVQVDAALVALRHAVVSLRQAAVAAKEYAPSKDVAQLLEVAQKSTVRSGERLALIAGALKSSDQELSSQTTELVEVLRRGAATDIDSICAAWKQPTSTETIALTEKVVEDFDRLLRRVETLQRSIVARVMDSADVTVSREQTPMSRRELTANVLKQLESNTLRELSKTVNVKRIRVDQYATPIAGDRSWFESFETGRSDGVINPENPKPGAASGIRASTNLTAALEMLSEGAAAESITAAVLFSDGGHNEASAAEPAVVAAGLAGLRVHVVPVSSQQPQRDLLIHRVDSPSSVTLNDKIVLDALVTGQYLRGENATLELHRAGQLIERRQLAFDSDRQDHRLRFSIPADHLGQQVFDLVAPPLADEMSTTNNLAVVAVRVLRDTMRVLLADRITRWEYRYLDQLFRRDKHVQLDKLLYAPSVLATGRLEATKELPRDVEGWASYDVVILGDLDPSTFDSQQQDALEEWVRKRGGNMILIAGREFMPHEFSRGSLSGILPVQELPRMTLDRNGYMPLFTPEGARHEALMLADAQAENTDLWTMQFRSAPIFFLSSFCLPKPAAHVLIEAAAADDAVGLADGAQHTAQQALLAWQDVGAGRVVFLASPVTYHLRFRRGDALHHRFWGQMLRWLTASARGKGQSQLFVRTPNARYDYGQPIEVTVSLANDDGSPIKGAEVSAIAEPSTGQRTSIPLTPDENVPGRYLGKFDKLQPGAYRVSAAGSVAEAIIAANPLSDSATAVLTVFALENIEMTNTCGNRALLREIAEITGGQVLPPTTVGEILQLSALAPRSIEESVRTPMWNRWIYLSIVVACLVTEWLIRRWIGLA